MHEFVFLAALDMGEDLLADRCLQPVLKRFPGSTRGQLLLGQWQEYKGQYAIQWATDILLRTYANRDPLTVKESTILPSPCTMSS